MSIDLRLPDIKGTDREQLKQIRSYLYQLVPQLQFALSSMETVSVVEQEAQKPAGTTSQSTSSLDAEVAFEALKPLIVKSAEIIQAYYEEISRMLSGEYVTLSGFGAFAAHTEQRILRSETEIGQAFSDIRRIFSDAESVTFTLAELNAHFRSGLLCYGEDGAPVYGLEIGQRSTDGGEEVFNKYARFTSDGFCLYDRSGEELAYIGGHKLRTRSLETTERAKTGGYVDIVTADGGVVTKWIGW